MTGTRSLKSTEVFPQEQRPTLSPPTRAGRLTWRQDNGFGFPLVSVVAEDISLLCAVNRRAERVVQGPRIVQTPR